MKTAVTQCELLNSFSVLMARSEKCMFLEGSENLFSHPATAASKGGSGVSGGRGILKNRHQSQQNPSRQKLQQLSIL